MLATPAEDVPGGPGWLFEVKFDGYRAVAYVRAERLASVAKRQGPDRAVRGRWRAQVARAVKTPSAVLDGEVCRLDPGGRASFSELQRGTGPLVYYVFDLLEADGVPLVDLPLIERRARLRELLDGRNRTVLWSEDFADGRALLPPLPSRGSKESSPSAPRRATSRGGAHASG